MMLVRFRLGGERFRHKSDFDEWSYTRRFVGVEDLIDNAPVVYRLARRVACKRIGGTPFQGGHAVARGQQVVRSVVHRVGAEVRKPGKKIAALVAVSVVRLVVSNPRPNGFEGT